MGKPGKSTGGAKPDDAAKTPPPPPPEDDECYEDGDIATPKLDHYGNDDEPL
ncbi:hypothetical protein CI1B_19830 [Bradyrhizobium ivorense]|uniref:Uncharacterized protein n=1 Tax=Bradyrhizobium ivorense TaxID=2511166 RepID=A0A508T206_9BRAD|nr:MULTISPECIES: hypothetical protein [Bradyrhizobium]MCC8942839.1 hypothetical protein [Bradyrhizobium ivorense]VIO67119.1 hypothetical protein CI41S_04810 [Bradyrhizobium ivorense]VIO68196.1 hypothetical protein CI1B_19830 [Bradyrhizobium ivorense]